jgi:hypothetical protein
MARILVGSVPAARHVNPLVPLVKALVAHGHDVRWIAGGRFRAKVEAAGADFTPMRHARDYDDARIDEEFPERTRLSRIAQLKFDMKHVFIDNGPGQLRDFQDVAASFRRGRGRATYAEPCVRCSTSPGTGSVHERSRANMRTTMPQSSRWRLSRGWHDRRGAETDTAAGPWPRSCDTVRQRT